MERPDFQLYLQKQKRRPIANKDEEDVSSEADDIIDGTELHIEEGAPPLEFVHKNSLKSPNLGMVNKKTLSAPK